MRVCGLQQCVYYALHKINILTSVILIACTAACTTNVQLFVQLCVQLCVCSVCVVWVSLLLFHAAAVVVVVAVCICIGIPLVWLAFACKNFRNSAEDARACGRITLGVAVEFPRRGGGRRGMSVNVAYSCADFRWLPAPYLINTPHAASPHRFDPRCAPI